MLLALRLRNHCNSYMGVCTLRIGCDIDGCLADFTHSYAELLVKTSGRNLIPNEEYLVNPPTWNWDRAAGYTKAEEQAAWNEIAKGDGFWRNLKPLPLGLAAMTLLNRARYAGHDVYFITHRMGKNAKKETESWFYRYDCDIATVLVAQDKLPIIKALELDFYIDDKPETIQECADALEAGNLPHLKHLFIINYAYNQHVERESVKRVGSVIEALRLAKVNV